MPPQAPLNFGSIPTATAAEPPDPDTSGLNFGAIPKSKSLGIVTPEASEDVARRERLRQIPEGPYTSRNAALPHSKNVDRLVTAMTPGVRLAETVDPTTPTGRKNLASGAAAGGMAFATEGMTALPWITRLLATPIAAAFGGSAAEAGEQVAGNHAPSGRDVAMAGAEQGAYELGGKAFMWPVRRGIAMFKAAPAVARQASEALEQGVSTARNVGADMLQRVREKGRQYLAGETAAATQSTRTAARAGELEVGRTRDMAAADLAAARKNVHSNIATVRQQAAQTIADAEQKGAASIAEQQAIYDEVLADAPSTLDAGRKVRAVVQPRDIPGVPKGAAQRALDVAGANVSEAAKSGPPIAVKPIQDALDRMAAEARPASIFPPPAPAENSAAGFVQSLRKSQASEAIAAQAAGGPGANTHVGMSKIEKAIREQIGITDEKHPLPGILGRVANMDPNATISFADAHQLKKLLDESVNFDRAASKHVEQLTKGIRATLREALAVHEPYNEATRAFAEVVPLYRKGVGKQLIKAAQEDPDRVVRVLSAKDPARAQAVKDLIVGQAAAGGDAAAGQQAWQAVQSRWVYDRIIHGGPEKLQQRLATVLTENPEFSKIVLGDPTAHRVLSNIDRIGEAFQHATQTAGEDLLAAKTAGAASVEQATAAGADALGKVRATGRQAIAGAKDAAVARLTQAKDDAAVRLTNARHAVADTTEATRRTARAGVTAAVDKRRAFAQSSLAAYGGPNVERQRLADMARAGVLGPRTFTGALSLVRLLTGPKNADLVEWAAYSDSNTQRLVAALQSRLPDSGVAALMRELATVLREPNDDASRTRTSATSQPR